MSETQITITVKAVDEGATSKITGIVSAVEDTVKSFKSVEEAAAKVVETVLKVIEKIKQMQEAVEKMRDGMEEAAAATAHQADAIDLANLKLQDQIAKLEGGHANNGLSEALIAAADQARTLTQALDAALQKTDELLKKESIGFLKSLVTGQEQTSDLGDKVAPQFERLKELRRGELLEAQEFHQKNREIELHGTEEQKQALAQQLINLQDKWNDQIQIVTKGINETVAAEQRAMDTEKQARIKQLTQDHYESTGDGASLVSAISLKEAEEQVNEQYKVRAQTLREIGVQATAYYQTVKSETENVQLREQEAAAKKDADDKAEEKRRATLAEQALRKNISTNVAQLDADKKVADARFKLEEETIRVAVAEHKIGAEEELKQEQSLLNRKLEADEAFLAKKLAQLKRDPTANAGQIATVQGEIEKIKIDHDTAMLKLDANYHSEVEKRNKKELKDEIEKVEEQVKQTKAGSLDRIKIIDDELKKLAAEDKASTDEYNRLLREKAQAEREFWKQMEAAAEVYDKSRQEHQQALRDKKLSNLEFDRQLGRSSESQYEQQLRNEITATYNASMRKLEDKKRFYALDPVEYAKTEAQIVKLTDKYNADIEKADQKSMLRRRQAFDQHFQQISSSFNTALNSWMQGTESASQAFSKMFQDILSQLIDFVEQWIEKKIEMWLMDKLISQGTQSAAATAQITSNAAVAYSGAYAATAAIPFVGPELAPEAAMMAYMDVMAITPAGFALGGIVPATGLALVHQGERVLPASMSGTGDFGAPSLHVHFNVNAIDSDSFKHTIKRHGNMIGNEVLRVLKKRGIAAK